MEKPFFPPWTVLITVSFFGISVQFLEISQKTAYNMLLLKEFHISRCNISALTIQLENICPSSALTPPFPVFLFLQPQVLCSLPRAALMSLNRLTLCRWHEKGSTVKMEGNFNSFKVGSIKFPVTHRVSLASNPVVPMALEQMIEVKSNLCTQWTFTHGATANILPYSHSFPMFGPHVSLRNAFTYSSSLPRKLSAAVITSKQTFRFKMSKSTTEKHIPPQFQLGNNCLEMLLNAFVQLACMLEIQSEKKSSALSPSPQVLIHFFWIRPTTLQNSCWFQPIHFPPMPHSKIFLLLYRKLWITHLCNIWICKKF